MSSLSKSLANIKVGVAKSLANYQHKSASRWKDNPWPSQRRLLNYLILRGRNTQFGKDHGFDEIRDYKSFKSKVPIRNYEELMPYFHRVKEGGSDVLWPGRPKYFAVSAGTTSGSKYLPITRESMPNHINATRSAILNYMHSTGNWDILNRNMIFIQASPDLEIINGIPGGRLSGIVAHHVPGYLQRNVMPSNGTNRISDWELKINMITEETLGSDMGIIGGIPPWLMMYFENLLRRSNKENLKELFPNLKLIVTGGVNLKPYQQKFKKIVGEGVDYLEVYPASEGFIAYQDNQNEPGLLLQVNSSIFYEFIKADEVFNEDKKRYTVQDVELNTNYAIALSSKAGFWGYLLGDTIKFVSLNPHKIVVTGRITQFISAFGEHVIVEEVESSINELCKAKSIDVTEFTVAPQVNPPDGDLPHHEWFIEYEKSPDNLDLFAEELDELMRKRNEYYRELIEGKTLKPLVIKPIKTGGFKSVMKETGKFGGQSKVIHISNNRDLAYALEQFTMS